LWLNVGDSTNQLRALGDDYAAILLNGLDGLEHDPISGFCMARIQSGFQLGG